MRFTGSWLVTSDSALAVSAPHALAQQNEAAAVFCCYAASRSQSVSRQSSIKIHCNISCSRACRWLTVIIIYSHLKRLPSYLLSIPLECEPSKVGAHTWWRMRTFIHRQLCGFSNRAEHYSPFCRRLVLSVCPAILSVLCCVSQTPLSVKKTALYLRLPSYYSYTLAVEYRDSLGQKWGQCNLLVTFKRFERI